MVAASLDIRITGHAEAFPRWSVSVPGREAHRVVVDAEAAIALVSDGWGVHPSAVRLHAIDLGSGTEIAAFRSGTSVRCVQRLTGSAQVLVASDTRLHHLELPSLVERARWTRRIPRYPDTMAVVEDRVLLANWQHPGIGIVDLKDGAVRRRPAPEMTQILPRGDRPLLVSGQAGGIWQIGLGDVRVTKMIDTPPAVDAALAGGRHVLWLIEGVRATIASSAPGITTVAPSPGGHIVRGYESLGSGGTIELRLPHAVQRIEIGGDRLWLHGESALLVVDPVAGDATSCALPPGLRIVAVAPDAGVVMATERGDDVSTLLTCFEVRE